MLFNVGPLGHVNPGFTPEVGNLLGIKKLQYLWYPELAPCRILAENPMLGAHKVGDIVNLPSLEGHVADIDGTPLMVATNDLNNHFSPPGSSRQYKAETVFPLYYRKLGKGDRA